MELVADQNPKKTGIEIRIEKLASQTNPASHGNDEGSNPCWSTSATG